MYHLRLSSVYDQVLPLSIHVQAVQHLLQCVVVIGCDGLTLTANDHNALQKMLDRLHVYAQRKHLIINTAKSEVVHFNSSGPDVPVLRIGEVPLVHKESFKYLGMMFHKRMSMAKSSEQDT